MAIDIKYTVHDGFDKVFDEKGNTFLALRKVSWGDGEPKLDLRKWYNGPNGETVGKGFSFLTEEGPHELTKVLVESGYGYTDEIIEGIKNREDFMTSLVKVVNKEDIPEGIDISKAEMSDDDFYDPKSIFEDIA